MMDRAMLLSPAGAPSASLLGCLYSWGFKRFPGWSGQSHSYCDPTSVFTASPEERIGFGAQGIGWEKALESQRKSVRKFLQERKDPLAAYFLSDELMDSVPSNLAVLGLFYIVCDVKGFGFVLEK